MIVTYQMKQQSKIHGQRPTSVGEDPIQSHHYVMLLFLVLKIVDHLLHKKK